MTTTNVRRILRHISRFGLRTGLQAARLHRQPSTPVQIQLDGVDHPLWARPGTSDAATFDEVFLSREYNVPFANFSPSHILDLGANVGYASVYFAARWPQARILAVEPSSQNLSLLEKNTHPWGRIVTLQAAVWSHATTMQIANPDGDANAFRMTEASGPVQEKIPAYTIPQLIERLGCTRLPLLKMDVEGAEVEIFRADTSWLDLIDVMVIELHDRLVPKCAMALNQALNGRSYQQEILGSNLVFDFRQ
ncbi:MAG: FkbM family methyltransferase [Nibricoccus sp.]